MKYTNLKKNSHGSAIVAVLGITAAVAIIIAIVAMWVYSTQDLRTQLADAQKSKISSLEEVANKLELEQAKKQAEDATKRALLAESKIHPAPVQVVTIPATSPAPIVVPAVTPAPVAIPATVPVVVPATPARPPVTRPRIDPSMTAQQAVTALIDATSKDVANGWVEAQPFLDALKAVQAGHADPAQRAVISGQIANYRASGAPGVAGKLEAAVAAAR